jgi:hypothetical protein
MSENQTDEVTNKITISPDDVDNIRKYCNHFGVDSTEELEKALDAFVADQTFENQMNIKLELCKWILTSDHDSFTDELWKAPKKAAEGAVYDLQFDKELDTFLSEEEDK